MTPEADTPLRIVIALGGNAIVRAGEAGTIEQQFAHAIEATRAIAGFARDGHRLLLTHGNGPVVGNIMLRGEAAAESVPPMPLYIADADSEGGIGLMLQQTLYNHLVRLGVERDVVTLVTQTVVDANDPAFTDPDKPIGPFLPPETAPRIAEERGWTLREYPGRGMRRVVPSPRPVEIVEAPLAARLASAGTLVIAAGGGGVPVLRGADGALSGADAVVDKDWAGALLAAAFDADLYLVLMESDRLYLDWGTPAQHAVDELSVAEAHALLDAGAFERGTMAPKIAAAAFAAQACGCTCVLCGPESLEQAVAGTAGTRILGECVT